MNENLFYIRSGARLIGVTAADIQRFDKYLTAAGRWEGCTSGGYGMFGIGSATEGTAVMIRAHVFQWAKFHRSSIPAGYEIDHIDFDRQNLSIGNLRCIPKSLNASLHSPSSVSRQREVARRVGLATAGEHHGNHTLTDEQVAGIRSACASGKTQREVAKAFGISFQHVSKIVRNMCRKARTMEGEV